MSQEIKIPGSKQRAGSYISVILNCPYFHTKLIQNTSCLIFKPQLQNRIIRYKWLSVGSVKTGTVFNIQTILPKKNKPY